MSTTMEIRAPAEQSEGTRSQILRWLKSIGDTVAEHEPLIEIETDKVTVEVAAPASGVLREIVKGEQEEIVPGEVLGRLERAGSGLAGSERGDAETPPPHGMRTPPIGTTPLTGATPLTAGAARSAHASSPGAGSPVRESQPARPADTRSAARLSPVVRRLLAERGLDPASIRGSGEGGRITVDDVLAHDGDVLARAGDLARDGDAPADAGDLTQSDVGLAHGRAREQKPSPEHIPSHSVPHSAIRKRIAEHMVQSLLHTAPHVTTVFEADMSAVIAHRASHRSDFEARGVPLTFTAYFLAAAVAAIRVAPEANSRWTESALELYDTVNIGVATALEDGGLVVPVLRGVESRDLFEIARGLNERVTAARTGTLQPADVRGGTFTISNHGVSGSLLAAPIVINQPQSAILGIGKLEKRVTVIGEDAAEQVIIRPKCYVTLTIDHRVMDGHQANRFLQTFVKTLETWPAR